MNTFIRKKSFFTVKNKILVKIIHILKKSIIIFRIVLLHLNHHKSVTQAKDLLEQLMLNYVILSHQKLLINLITASKVSKYGVFPGLCFPVLELNSEIYYV